MHKIEITKTILQLLLSSDEFYEWKTEEFCNCFVSLEEVDFMLEILCILTTAGWLIIYKMVDISHWPVLYVHNLIFWF